MDLPVAETVDDLTSEWLSSALERDVTGVVATRIGTGQMGTSYRLALSYADGSSGPDTLVAKLAAIDPATRSAVAQGYQAEVTFYADIAHTVDVRTPTCWRAVISADGTTFTLLLDDLAPAQPGVQVDGCSLTHARSAVANLVGLHAHRWNDPGLDTSTVARAMTPEGAQFVADLQRDATARFVERFADRLGPDDPDTLMAAAEATARWHLLPQEHRSFNHGDYRLDNLMFSADGTEVSAVDWQTLAVGPPLRDVAYFLGNSVLTEVRRAHERQLVADYHAAVVQAGVTGYDAEQCWHDYRLGHFQGPMITTLGWFYASAQTPASDEMFCAMAMRAAAALRDLDSFAALG